jgi:hypothetical protein
MSRRDRAVGWEDVEDLGFLGRGAGDGARRRGRRGETKNRKTDDGERAENEQ